MFKGLFKYIIISQVLTAALFSLSLLFLNKKLNSTEVENLMNSTVASITDDVRDQVHQMITIVEGLSENHEITNQVFTKSKTLGLHQGGSYLKTIQSLNKVSYLWYLSPEGRVLGRVHGRDSLGDDFGKSEAFEMAKSQKTYGMSFTAGPAGQPTITLVAPVLSQDHDQKLMGFIQIATDLKDLFHDLKYEQGLRLALLYQKEKLNKDIWGRSHDSNQSAWDDSEGWVLVSYSGSANYFKEYLKIAHKLPSKIMGRSSIDSSLLSKNTTSGFSAPLRLNDQDVASARVLIFIDEVNILTLAEKLSWIVMLLIAGVSVSTIVALYFVNQRILGQQQQLDQAGKMSTLGELSSGIIHEIRNPLAVIQTSTFLVKKLAEQETIDKDKVIRHSEKINSMVSRIVKIANIISIYSRKSDNDPFEKVQFQAIVDDSLELVREPIMKRGVEIKLEIKDSQVECRGIQLSQVIVNLLKNAADAIETRDEKWVLLKSEINEKDQLLVVSVTDSGPGIPKDIAEKIFTKFYTTKGAGQGTGLGLSICQSIVEAHRGKIYVDTSCVNTKFVVEVPITQKA